MYRKWAHQVRAKSARTKEKNYEYKRHNNKNQKKKYVRVEKNVYNNERMC